MHYEEKMINGVLMCRNTPDGKWGQCSIEKMSQQIIDLKNQVAAQEEYQRNELKQSREDGYSEGRKFERDRIATLLDLAR